MRKVNLGLTFLLGCFAVVLLPSNSDARAVSKTVKSGKTQVVAKAGNREITLSELRSEMGRLRLSPNNPEAERLALDSIVGRVILADAARKAELHRRPEAIAQMKASQDQALADLYLMIASQPAEPSREEIDDYIANNQTLFAKRRSYEFSVLILPTENFDEEKMTPLFDEASTFANLEEQLRRDNVAYSVNNSIQPSTAFPKEIREQLGRYSVRDNIVLKGQPQTQIMKIIRVRPAVQSSEDWLALARRLLLDENAAQRASDLLERLRDDTAVTYYRKSVAPKDSKGVETAASKGKER